MPVAHVTAQLPAPSDTNGLFRLDTLRVKNFRCFEDFELDLHARMTVLHADNGGGKTSLLAALAVGMGGWFSDLGVYAKRNIRAPDVRTETRFVGRVAENVSHYPVRVECQGTVGGEPIQWARSLRRVGGSTTTRELAWLTAKTRQLLQRVQQSPDVDLPVLALYGTQRLFRQARETESKQPPERQTRLYGYLDCLNPASNEKQLLSWLYQEAMAEFQTGTPLPQYQALRGAILRALGGGFVDLAYDARQREPCLVHHSGEVLPWSRFSDGYHTFIGMVADVAWRTVLLNPHRAADAPAYAEGLVVIDEVDLHLHPTWQRRVLGDLLSAFPRLQFVVTTHSPQVLGSAKREWLRGLSPGADRADVGVAVEGRDSNAILDDVMGAASRDPEMTRALEHLFQHIDDDAMDLAREELAALAEKLGWEDTSIVRAQARMHRS